MQEIGKRNIVRPKNKFTSNYHSNIPRSQHKNIEVGNFRNKNIMNEKDALLKHQIWKINNKRRKMEALNNFEMRRELAIQRKKKKKKELEEKYYGFDFQPRINKKRKYLFEKSKLNKIKKELKELNSETKNKKKLKPKVFRRKINTRKKQKFNKKDKYNKFSSEEENEEDYDHSEDEMDKEYHYQYTPIKNLPKFKKFTQIKEEYIEIKNDDKLDANQLEKIDSEDESDESVTSEETSKLIEMGDEDDIPDQLDTPVDRTRFYM